MKKLKTGVAYHGNRMLSHARADMAEIASCGMDIVVHMLSHTDWERHSAVMKDIFAATEDAGLEVWVDNWGLGGAPGDRSHFLAYQPDAHMMLSDGSMHPYMVCLNSPEYRSFVKDWLDKAREIGGKTVFWDEPFMPVKGIDPANGKYHYTCTCDRCKKKFEERYGRPMPTIMDRDAEEFRTATIVEFLDDMTSYAHSLELVNTCCVMLDDTLGISLNSIDRICSLPHLDNIGSDPYWLNKEGVSPYEYVYNGAKKNIEIADRFGKDHNVWIQTYNNPRGREEEIIEATDAAYDAGARTILAWGYRGSESNDYRAHNPERAWWATVEGMKRIKSREYDRILEENRKKYKK